MCNLIIQYCFNVLLHEVKEYVILSCVVTKLKQFVVTEIIYMTIISIQIIHPDIVDRSIIV